MIKRVLSIGALVTVIAAVVLATQVFFIVDEREQAIITQFGGYLRTVDQPGLAVKAPFVQVVKRFDRRILVSDAPQAEDHAGQETACGGSGHPLAD